MSKVLTALMIKKKFAAWKAWKGLQKDPKKEYILWPDRSNKMTAFIDKLLWVEL